MRLPHRNRLHFLPPIFRVRRTFFKPKQTVASRLQSQTAKTVTPFLFSPARKKNQFQVAPNVSFFSKPAVFDVFVHNDGERNSRQSVIPAGDEHQNDAKAHTSERQDPNKSNAKVDPTLSDRRRGLTSDNSGTWDANWES